MDAWPVFPLYEDNDDEEDEEDAQEGLHESDNDEQKRAPLDHLNNKSK
eukprot:gene24106-30409_t